MDNTGIEIYKRSCKRTKLITAPSPEREKEKYMERIKFRAWDNIGKCMIDWSTICQTAFNRPADSKYPLMYNILTNQTFYGDNFGFSVMLFTGAKDIKQVEIYKGDILRIDEKIVVVEYDQGCFRTPHNESNYRLGGWKPGTIEVIGNICEHPNLLPRTPNPLPQPPVKGKKKRV